MVIEVSRIIKTVDGDSFVAEVVQAGKSYEIAVRVQGIDCPEMRGKCKYERKLARKAARFTADMLKAELIELNILDIDFYGRVLCDVFCDEESLASSLINAGLAKTYEGSKWNWC